MNLTVEWVDQNDVYESDVYSERTPKLLQPMIPVIRVAALRRWLHLMGHDASIGYRSAITDLLAQLPEKGTR